MQSSIEISRAHSPALSLALSPSKWGSFADQICKKSNLIKGRSCNCNFGVESFLTSFRSYLEKPLVLEVTARVTAPLCDGGGGDHVAGRPPRPERRFMLLWTEKSPHFLGAVTTFVATLKIGGSARPHLRNPSSYKGSKLQLKLRGQSLFQILQTLSVKNPHLEGGDKSGDTWGLPPLRLWGRGEVNYG
jgi:hypothetical protein